MVILNLSRRLFKRSSAHQVDVEVVDGLTGTSAIVDHCIVYKIPIRQPALWY